MDDWSMDKMTIEAQIRHLQKRLDRIERKTGEPEPPRRPTIKSLIDVHFDCDYQHEKPVGRVMDYYIESVFDRFYAEDRQHQSLDTLKGILLGDKKHYKGSV